MTIGSLVEVGNARSIAASPGQDKPGAHDNGFEARYRRWQALHRQAGSGRSCPHAWRLPELARHLGADARQRAAEALALDLFTLARWHACLEVLPQAGDGALAHVLMQRVQGLLHAPAPVAVVAPSLECALLDYLLNRVPAAHVGATLAGAAPDDAPLAELLGQWRRMRQGAGADIGAAHRVVAAWRGQAPAPAVLGEAVLAEIIYLLAPRWAGVWLEHALDQVERYSQHYLKLRLLVRVAQARAAAGELAESARRERQTQALAQRLGAEGYWAHLMAPERITRR